MIAAYLVSTLLQSAVPVASAAPAAWNIVPFGIGVYVHKRPLRGAAYTFAQAGGISTLSVASVLAADRAEEQDAAGVQRMQTLASIGVTAAIGGYFISVLDGARLHELEVEQAKLSVREWDRARWLAEAER